MNLNKCTTIYRIGQLHDVTVELQGQNLDSDCTLLEDLCYPEQLWYYSFICTLTMV